MFKLVKLVESEYEIAYKFEGELSFGVSSYDLPEVDAEFKGAYCSMLRLTEKKDVPEDSEDQSHDFEIKDGKIKFTPSFISVLDFEGEEIVKLIYARRIK